MPRRVILGVYKVVSDILGSVDYMETDHSCVHDVMSNCGGARTCRLWSLTVVVPEHVDCDL